MKGTISITVDNIEELRSYAKYAGFKTASDLLRYAASQHMRRYPQKNARAVQPEATGGRNAAGQ